jgi:catechol 2,3-dioxygenase-like lactoylglutathione lyase family enzyme
MTMAVFKAFQHVTIASSDRTKALAFYRDLLGFAELGQLRFPEHDGLVIDYLDMGQGHILEILTSRAPSRPSDWIPNDLQVGYRHVGLAVDSVDAVTARLKAAGVPFTLDPLDAKGNVRIAFFKDPDGALLEIVQGELQFDEQREGPPPKTIGRIVLDHITLTVADLGRSLDFYCDILGGRVRGQLEFNDERGFLITYVLIGAVTIEIFSFKLPTIPRTWSMDARRLGWNHLGLLVDDVDASMREVTAAGAPVQQEAVDARGNVRTAWVRDPDGYPVEFIDGTCDYDPA